MASTMRRDSSATAIQTRDRDRSSRIGGWGLASFTSHLAEDRLSSVSSLIESEIIPRLMVAHAMTPRPAVACVGQDVITAAEVEGLAPLALRLEADALLVHVETILGQGISFDTVLVDLLAPTARLLGEYWEEDRCDFVDVTMGLWRLQEVVHELSGRFPPGHIVENERHRALFASMPGDQHSFGTVVIDELFRSHGWLTERMSEAQTPDLLKCAADGWFDLVGLTVSCDCHIAQIAPIIAALRNVSHNPYVSVMVGGRIFSVDPDLAVQVGADGTASRADLALEVACKLVRDRNREHCLP